MSPLGLTLWLCSMMAVGVLVAVLGRTDVGMAVVAVAAGAGWACERNGVRLAALGAVREAMAHGGPAAVLRAMRVVTVPRGGDPKPSS